MTFRRVPIQKVLCVAEKNDAAKGIADLMSNSRMRRREGFSKFNKIYEYEYHLFGQCCWASSSVSWHRPPSGRGEKHLSTALWQHVVQAFHW
ncbi:hypothetical protein FKM82_002860 [Ascaphus truei]